MTAKQAEVWSLYASGHTVTQIARCTGRSKGYVSGTIKALKERGGKSRERRAETVPCPYSSSCFTCPMGDCIMGGANWNLLPVGYEYLLELEVSSV